MAQYLEKESLILPNKRLAKIDPQIANSLLSPSNREDAEVLKSGSIKRELLGERLLKLCSPYYRVISSSSSSSENEKPKAGVPPKVTILIESRQGKKTVTRISGLEPFGIDAKSAAEHLQKVCAGSASVGQLGGSSPKNPVMEIVVQGSQKKAVETFLEKRGVGGKYVNFVDKTGGKKK
jgi:translation initiation factor 2D